MTKTIRDLIPNPTECHKATGLDRTRIYAFFHGQGMTLNTLQRLYSYVKETHTDITLEEMLAYWEIERDKRRDA